MESKHSLRKRNADEIQVYNEPAQEEIQWASATRRALSGTWSVVRLIAIFICGLMLVSAVCLYSYQYINFHYLSAPNDGEIPQEIIVTKGMSLNKLSLLLEDKKLVRSAKVFKYYVDFSGYGSKIKAGTYVLDSSMTMQAIMEKLAKGDEGMQVTTFTITEGSTIEQVAAQLQKQNIISDSKKFLDLCKTGESFQDDYPFIKDVKASKNSGQRRYMLEGYLFPAKYEIYVGANEEQIINKMLAKTASILNNEMKARAKTLNMTVDQVLTLASIIEREAKTDDFTKVSAVFHNRLEENMAFGSDVTVMYAVHKGSNSLVTNEDKESTSLYNTYKYKGLPLGPIANPGQKAIDAALHPDEQTMKDGYYYFVLTDPETGKLAFNKTLEEHNEDVEKYKPLWDAYNKAHGIK